MAQKKFVFIITQSFDRPDLAATLTWQRKNQFSPISDLMETLIDEFSCRFYICASCVKHFELDKVELIANAEVKPGSFLAEMLVERQSLTF
jgi:predicted peroxiredoxin